MKNNPIDIVLEEKKFTEEEKKKFIEVIKYAKVCQQGLNDDTLKSFINEKVEEIVKNEVHEG